MSGKARQLSGRCLCGAVTFEVPDAFEYAAMCHCSKCRLATGTGFKPFAGIRREALTVTGGKDSVLVYGDERARDLRCARCGSMIYSIVRDDEYVHVPMGALVDSPAIRPSEHIFVASKAPWDTICDGLPQYAGHSFEGPPINAGAQK